MTVVASFAFHSSNCKPHIFTLHSFLILRIIVNLDVLRDENIGEELFIRFFEKQRENFFIFDDFPKIPK